MSILEITNYVSKLELGQNTSVNTAMFEVCNRMGRDCHVIK